MVLPATREQLEWVTSKLESATYAFGLLAAIAGVSFLAFNRQLQQFTKKDFQDFQKTITETNALSEAAKADATTARAQIAASETERARLELRLKEVEVAHSKLAATNAETEQEIVKLKESQKPRSISAAQSTQIAGFLKPFSGQNVVVQMYGQDSETQVFANQVAAILEQAGLKVTRNNVIGMSGTGLSVVVHDAESAPSLAGTIQHAFRAAGIDMGGLVRPDVVKESRKFLIAVGEKPKL